MREGWARQKLIADELKWTNLSGIWLIPSDTTIITGPTLFHNSANVIDVIDVGRVVKQCWHSKNVGTLYLWFVLHYNTLRRRHNVWCMWRSKGRNAIMWLYAAVSQTAITTTSFLYPCFAPEQKVIEIWVHTRITLNKIGYSCIQCQDNYGATNCLSSPTCTLHCIDVQYWAATLFSWDFASLNNYCANNII